MKPWQPQSGVWYASGWIMKWAFSPAFFTPSIISFTVFRHVSGSKWQLMPTMWAPERRHVDFHQQSNDQVEFWRIFVWQFVFRCILNLQPRALWASVVLRFFESTPFFPPLDFLFRTVPKPPVGHYGLYLRLFPLLVFNHHADLQLTFIFHIEFIVCWINATPSVKTLLSLQCKDAFLVVFPLSGAKVTCLTRMRSNLHSSFSPLRCLSWFRFCSGCLCWLENI